MIEEVAITRFKNLSKFTCTLGRVTVLVGANNAGKSSVIQSLQFANSLVQSIKIDGVSRWGFDEVSGTLATEQLVYIPFRDIDALAHGGRLTQTAGKEIVIEIKDDAGNSCLTTVKRGRNKNLTIKVRGRNLGRQLESLDRPFAALTPGLAGIPAREEFRSEGLVRRAAAKGDANSVLRNILWILKRSPADWKSFTERFERVFPTHSINVRFDESRDEIIDATVDKSGTRLPIDAVGTGVLQVIQILAYIGVYNPKLLLLDEPDSHLHPANQRILGRLLVELAEELDFQVLLTTHSRHLLDELTGAGASLHWVDDGRVRDEEFDNVSVLLDLGALDAGDRLRNGQTPWVLLTEDSNVDLVRTVICSNGLKPSEIAIWSYRSCSKIESALMLASFIREHAPGTRIIVHKDRDYIQDLEISQFEKSMRENGIVPFVTTGTDIESHFLNPEYLSTVVAALSPEAAEELVAAARREASADSLSIYTRAKVNQEMRRLRGTGSEPDYSMIAQQCENALDADPERFVHGKKALKALRRMIQQETKQSRIAFGSSTLLRVPTLHSAVTSDL